jgi:hypothetical protein
LGGIDVFQKKWHTWVQWALLGLLPALLCCPPIRAATFEISPATVDTQEEFEQLANALRPGDELRLQQGVYSQNGRRAVSVQGTEKRPIVICAVEGENAILTRPADNRDRQNNIEFIDCAYLVVRGLRFQGGSSGVRFIRGHHISFEACEIFATGNNALTMNSGDCRAFVIRKNHIHHTGLSQSRPTEGEGMYIGCHDGSCITTYSLIEDNYIHHLRSTSVGGNDGIEIKKGSYGNTVRNNIIHDTNIGRQYPGIFVYGGGPEINTVEGNVIWNAGEGIQVVSDALIKDNVIFNCALTGITAAPHAVLGQVRNVTIIGNEIAGQPTGVLLRWAQAQQVSFQHNRIHCPSQIALNAQGVAGSIILDKHVEGHVKGLEAEIRR